MIYRIPRWLSICQVALAVLTTILLVPLAVIAVIWGLGETSLFTESHGDPVSAFILAAILLGISLLVLPSGYYGLMRLKDRQAIDSFKIIRNMRPGVWIYTLPVLILLGSLVSQSKTAAWFFLPPIHLLAIGIPIVWIVFLAVRGLPTGSSQRVWGVFDLGITLVPLLIMFCELLAAAFFLIVFVIYFMSQPEFADYLTNVFQQLSESASLESMADLTGSYYQKPLVVGLMLVFIALIVPLIEELFKPLGVWLLMGGRLSPAAGFTAGVLSGAGYGLIENLLLSGNTQDWSFLVLARTGTMAVHVLTAGLMGWAIVQVRFKKRFLRLVLAYFAAVLIHGMWNGLTLLYSFQAVGMLRGISEYPVNINSIAAAAPFGLIFLALGCFFLLLRFNKILQLKETV